MPLQVVFRLRLCSVRFVIRIQVSFYPPYLNVILSGTRFPVDPFNRQRALKFQIFSPILNFVISGQVNRYFLSLAVTQGPDCDI